MSQENPVENAVRFVAEVANQYASTLDKVAKEPFVLYVNGCFAAIFKERQTMTEEIANLNKENTNLQSQLEAYFASISNDPESSVPING